MVINLVSSLKTFGMRQKVFSFSYIYSGIYSSVVVIAQAVVYLWGGYRVMRGEISLGHLIIIINYFQKVLNSITYISETLKEYQDSNVSWDRICQILHEKKQMNILVR